MKISVKRSRYIVKVLPWSRFLLSAGVLPIMVIGMFFFVLNMPYGNLILGMNRLWLGAVLQITSLALFVVLNDIYSDADFAWVQGIRNCQRDRSVEA